MPEQAFGYVRVSGRGQIDGDGPDRQRQAIADWSARTGCEVVRVYEDLGVSGTLGISDRPGLSLLVADLIASGGIPPLIVVERADRLARDLLQSELILRKLTELGVRVILAETGSSLSGDDTPSANLIRQILGAVAQFDKGTLVSRLRRCRDAARKKNGRCEGPKPYGIDDIERGIVDLILRKRSFGKTFQAIADELNSDGVFTRRGKKWSGTSAWRICLRARNTTESCDSQKEVVIPQAAEAFPKLLENVGCTANFPQAASLDAALTDG